MEVKILQINYSGYHENVGLLKQNLADGWTIAGKTRGEDKYELIYTLTKDAVSYGP